MVQVENEVGLLRDSRDRSPEAEAAWRSAGAAGRCSTISWHTRASSDPSWPRSGPGRATGSRARGRRSSATTGRRTRSSWPGGSRATAAPSRPPARRSRPLPMYANAWLGPQPGQPHAGDYPSGGPVGRVIDVWKAAAPSLDLVAPDIYVDDAKPVLARLRPAGQPGVRSRVAVRHRPDVLGARAPPGAGLLGVRRRPRPPGRPARPRVRPARRDGGRHHGRPGRGTDRRRPPRRRRDRAAVLRSAATTVVARNSRALLGRMLLDAGVGEPPPRPRHPARPTAVRTVRRRPTRAPSPS